MPIWATARAPFGTTVARPGRSRRRPNACRIA